MGSNPTPPAAERGTRTPRRPVDVLRLPGSSGDRGRMGVSTLHPPTPEGGSVAKSKDKGSDKSQKRVASKTLKEKRAAKKAKKSGGA